jgi:hypothetical protein
MSTSRPSFSAQYLPAPPSPTRFRQICRREPIGFTVTTTVRSSPSTCLLLSLTLSVFASPGQYVDGLRAPFNILPNKDTKRTDLTWDEEYTIVLADWYQYVLFASRSTSFSVYDCIVPVPNHSQEHEPMLKWFLNRVCIVFSLLRYPSLPDLLSRPCSTIRLEPSLFPNLLFFTWSRTGSTSFLHRRERRGLESEIEQLSRSRRAKSTV